MFNQQYGGESSTLLQFLQQNLSFEALKKRWSNMQIFGLMLKTTLVICMDSRDFVKIFSAGNSENKKSNVEQKNLKISKLVELN